MRGGAAATRRIKLIVTGDMEKVALAPSIERIFQMRGPLAGVQLLAPMKVDSFTSDPLPSPSPAEPVRSPLRRLAKAVVAEALEGADGTPASNARQRARAVIQATCSFHLLSPMVESYVFGEPLALERAGVASSITPQLAKSDLEDFETDDAAYLASIADRQHLASASGRTWLRYEKHPKEYLAHLCGRSGVFYSETTEGARALGTLDWAAVASVGAPLPFARSLFEDLADFLGVANPLGLGPLAPQTYPARHVDRATLVLRNM